MRKRVEIERKRIDVGKIMGKIKEEWNKKIDQMGKKEMWGG